MTFAATLFGVFSVTTACDVPVHRYLLSRCEREPYRFYYFYSSEEDLADSKVNDFLGGAARSLDRHVNLVFQTVDVNGLSSRPAQSEERKLWEEHKSDELPIHIALTPHETLLFRGRLNLPTAKAMIQSPLRMQIARELCAGEGGVLLLLFGEDKEESKRAEEDIRWVLEKAEKEQRLEVGFFRLSREDPEEEWLVRSLLDLVEEPARKKGCVVFAICGRARVIAGCVADGITRENIIECVSIMSGECSCDLMFMRTGMDLLTDWDWDAAAAGLGMAMEEPVNSVMLGFDDTGQGSPATAPGEGQKASQERSAAVFWTHSLARWGGAFGIACLIVIGVGLVMLKKRKEL